MQPYWNNQVNSYMPYQMQYMNPMFPYQERLAQMQAQYNTPQYNQPVQQNSASVLNGEIVDGIDVVKAKNVDMSGNITFYPKSDLTEIYTKQLQMDGTSRIVTYKAVHPQENKPVETNTYVDIQTLNAMLEQMKSEILQSVGGGLSEIKQMITLPEQPKRQRGGNQNND